MLLETRLSNGPKAEIPGLETLRLVRYLLHNRDPYVLTTRHKCIKGLKQPKKRKVRTASQLGRGKDAGIKK